MLVHTALTKMLVPKKHEHANLRYVRLRSLLLMNVADSLSAPPTLGYGHL
jgi:hypothetical protein